MQLIGIVLLLLVGLSGSKDVLGKKRAWDNRHCNGLEDLVRDQSSTFRQVVQRRWGGSPGEVPTWEFRRQKKR
jgi:hypothetical protein